VITVSDIVREFRPRGWMPGSGNGKRFRALDGVSLTVEQGEIYGLVGPNGAGKTTLVKIIATLLEPTSGGGTVNGHDIVHDGRGVRAAIGLSAENERAFYWRLTGRQNLEFFAALQGLQPAETRARIAALLAELDLEADADKQFMRYSTGMKRKLSVARALLTDPPVLILDEPTSNVDPAAAERVRDLITRAQRAGKTVLLTSHNMFEIERVAERVGVIDEGRLVAEGTVSQLRDALGRSTLTLEATREIAGLEARLRDLPGVTSVRTDGQRAKITTEDREESLNALLEVLHADGVRVRDLRVENPSLEDVFFALTEEREADV